MRQNRFLRGKEKELGPSKLTVVSYAGGVLTSNEGNFYRELRGIWLGLSFDFACRVIGDEVLEH